MSDPFAAKAAKPTLFQSVMLRFPRALQEIAKVGVAGCEKYGVPLHDTSFLDVPGAYPRLTDAMMRHVVLEPIEGSVNIDPADKGGYLHAAHAAWNAMARLEFALRERERAAAKAVSTLGLDCGILGDTDIAL